MRCPNEHENPAGAKFCNECGAKLPVGCPGCGAAITPTAKFCSECGAALTPAAAPAAPPAAPAPPPVETPREAPASLDAKFASPESYTPRHLADKILTSKSALEGERKRVTVMFVDVCGFTTISEQLDPEDVHAIMDRAFEIMLEAVHRYEGSINQFLGDGIMALFGAPIAHEDHPHRGLSASLAIREGLKPLQEDVRRTHGVDFRVRMGLNTGLVVVGAIGRDLRMDYTAVGDTTNLTARLMSLAQPGQIVVSRRTQHLRERFFRWEDLGEFQVKGKSEPVQAYALIDDVHGQTRLEVSRERGLTPLIGREREVASLVETYRRAAAGHGTVALISGEPGVGKSRLLYEFLRAIETEGGLALESSCVAYGRAMPYRPILELVRSYLGLVDEMTKDEIRRRAEKGLLEVGVEGDEPAAILAHALGAPAPADLLGRLGAQIKERTFAVLRDLLTRASDTAPLALVVENVHWIDTTSEEFLAYLAREVSGHRIVLLLTTRPGATTSALADRAEPKLVLEGLRPDDQQRMVTSLVPAAERVSAELLAMLVEKSAGNPLYVEEILRQLQETDGLEVVDGEATLGRGAVTVPATIHDIIAARIDRVADELKRTMQGAAVIGRRFGVSLLSRVLDVPGESITERLRELHQQDFIFPAAEDPELMYSFKHALTQDVVYASVLERRRREYHGAAGRGLEELYPTRVHDVVELVAYHFRLAQVWDKAAGYLRQAALKAQAISAHREALSSLEGALEALRHLPEAPETRAQEIDVRLDLRGSLYPLGEFEKMVTYLREAEAMATEISDAHRLGLVSIHLAEYCRQTGRFVEARAMGEQALAMAEQLQDVPLRLYAGHYLGLACHALGDYGRAAELLRAVVQTPATEWRAGAFGGTVSGSGTWEAFQAVNLGWLARSLAERGEFDEAMDAGRRAVALGEGLGSPYIVTVAYIGLGYVSLVRGDRDAAITVLERACQLGRDAKLTLLYPQAGRLLGSAYLDAGRVDEAVALVQAAADEVESRRLLMQHAAVLNVLAQAYLRVDRVDEASTTALRALKLAREGGQRGDEALALHVLGDAAAGGSSEIAGAEPYYLAAIELAGRLEMRPLLARSQLALGRLYLRAGDRDRAQEHLLAATRLFVALDMPARLREAEVSPPHGLTITDD